MGRKSAWLQSGSQGGQCCNVTTKYWKLSTLECIYVKCTVACYYHHKLVNTLTSLVLEYYLFNVYIMRTWLKQWITSPPHPPTYIPFPPPHPYSFDFKVLANTSCRQLMTVLYMELCDTNSCNVRIERRHLPYYQGSAHTGSMSKLQIHCYLSTHACKLNCMSNQSPCVIRSTINNWLIYSINAIGLSSVYMCLYSTVCSKTTLHNFLPSS